MTTIIYLQTSRMSVHELIALACSDDDVIRVEGDVPIARVTAMRQPKEAKPRIAGLNRGSF